ncbi:MULTISPECIES: hypothetical protein [unclassified Blastococcus]
MAGRGRRRGGSQAAWTGQRRMHVEQVTGHRFVVGWGPRRSATVVPAPLRYWQYEAPGPVAWALAALVVVGWVGLAAWRGGGVMAGGELPWAVGAALLVLLLNVRRTTVSDHGLSTTTAGTRPDPAEVVALGQVREVRTGRPPAGWPAPRQLRGWLPGRARVAVRYAGDDGAEQALTRWVRDPDAFAEALGAPL